MARRENSPARTRIGLKARDALDSRPHLEKLLSVAEMGGDVVTQSELLLLGQDLVEENTNLETAENKQWMKSKLLDQT